MASVHDLKAGTVREALECKLAPLPAPLRRPATFDDGSDFAEYQSLAAAVDMKMYFAKITQHLKRYRVAFGS